MRPGDEKGRRVTLVDAELAVQALVADDVSLGEIEQYVAELPLDDEHKSALWLLAWSHTTRPRRRNPSRTTHRGRPSLATSLGASPTRQPVDQGVLTDATRAGDR
jgi:hypothetical protein